jgi:hypothetical protein
MLSRYAVAYRRAVRAQPCTGVINSRRKAGVEATYVEIDSERGRLASGADAGKWASALRDFMRQFGVTA